MTAFTLWRFGLPKMTLLVVGTSTTRKSTSRLLALVLSPKRTGRRIIHVGFTSYPPKPRIGCTKGTTSRSGCASFCKESQVMMSAKLPVSTKIRRTIALAIFISMIRGSLWGEVNRAASFPPNTIMGTVKQGPRFAVSTCYAFLSCAFPTNRVIPSA